MAPLKTTFTTNLQKINGTDEWHQEKVNLSDKRFFFHRHWHILVLTIHAILVNRFGFILVMVIISI